MVRSVIRSSLSRGLSVVLVAGQVLLSVPIAAAAQMPARPAPKPAESKPPAPPKVTVNRTVPRVTPPPSEPQFSARPTVQEIARARVFAEPVVPVGGEPTAGENLGLARALLVFHRSGGTDWRGTIGQFLSTHPESPWRASLLAHVGTLRLREHGYSRALEAWNDAWMLAKDATDPSGRAVADFAVAEWLELAASFGPGDAVQARLASIADRPISGTAGVKVAAARETRALIARERRNVVPCAAEALLGLLAARGGSDQAATSVLASYRAPEDGTSLVQVQALGARVGVALQMAARTTATEVPVPSIVHGNVGHFTTVVERQADRYRIVDGNRSYWVHRDTLLDESSGYFLLPGRALPNGWRAVEAAEASGVRGFSSVCPPGGPPPSPPPPTCPPPGGADGGCGGGPSGGMATYRFQAVTASLLLQDTPVGYTPARGPAVPLTISYHHRNLLQPQTFTSAHVGPKWTLDWLRFVQEVPTDALGVSPPHVWVYQPPGGREVYEAPDANGVYPVHWNSRAVFVRVSTSPIRYERRLPGGTVEVYAASDGAPAGQQRVFLTELIDPLGQRLQFTWDAQARLVALTDALGQVTTIAYAHATDPLKVTTLTDPFGRVATLSYNGAGQLASITDVLGLTSAFGYGPNDFVSSLTTPYGTTSFRHEPNALNQYNLRFIEATDPLGGTERAEFQWQTPALAVTAPAAEVPAGFAGWNTSLDHYTTFYWDKRAWMLGPGDLTKAVQTHWLFAAERPGGTAYSSPVPHSVKRPLEGRVWYAYPGQTAGAESSAGWWREPSRVGRVLDDGTSQISEATYTTQGSALTKTDPLGRQTSYTYSTDGVTPIDVRQTTGGMNDLLATYSNFNVRMQPQITTDAAGQATTVTYNAAGQPLTVTNAKNETTTYAYDAAGRLSSVAGAVSGATSTYTYDAYGRPRATTDADGYTVTIDYDVFDRPIRSTYPDATYEETTYARLDVSTRRDRAGRLTRYTYDALRRLTATRDPAGRVIAQAWCGCGSLDALIDANGNRTRWERDLQGRVTREVRADDVTATVYTYGAVSGRLLTVTDPKQQVTTTAYLLDNAIASTTYTSAPIATPGVSYTYDGSYGRLATMTDGTGLTTYAYHAVGQLGGGQVASVDGPLTNDTITYAYDQLGRATTRAINGVGVTWAFDALGRVTSEANVLGTFSYTYDAATSRVATVTYPNAQTSAYTYFPNANDRRLQTIHHRYPNGTTLSKFDYTYDADGNILTWRQQADATAVLWEYVYDRAGQLLGAVKNTTDTVPTVLKRYFYTYDPAGNRTVEQIDDQVTGATYDSLNRLVSQQPSGAMAFAGTVNEPATVTVQGKPASVTLGNAFSLPVPVVPGTNTVTVNATDPSGNTATKQYEVDSLGSGRTFTYDANGNLSSDGSRTFEWDVRNQLIAVVVGTHRTEFSYDGFQRRVRTVEKEGGAGQSDTEVVWCGTQICEERETGNPTSTRRLVPGGEQLGAVSHFFTGDHLGSVHAVTDGSGTLLSMFAFDPWGRRGVVSGSNVTTAGFTGHKGTAVGNVWTALYRVYDPDLGRWLSADPLGFIDGPNLYGYVKGNPISSRDNLGLSAGGVGGGVSGAVAAGLLGVQGNADCSVVVDGSGNVGLLCCASAGPAYGLAIQGGASGKGVFCKGCKTICELEGPSISVSGGLGPVGGSGSFGSSPASGSVSVGPRGGLGGYVGFGLGGCKLVTQRRPCNSCDPKK